MNFSILRSPKKLSVISYFLIGVATIGFFLVPFFFENLVSEKTDYMNLLNRKRDTAIFNLGQATEDYDKAGIINDKIKLLKSISPSDNLMISQYENEKLIHLKHATYSAINAAGLAFAYKPDKIKLLESKVENMSTYEEIFPIYRESVEQASAGYNAMADKLDLTVKQKQNLSKAKNLLWYTCLFLQGFGVLFGFLSIFYEKWPERIAQNRTTNKKKRTSSHRKK